MSEKLLQNYTKLTQYSAIYNNFTAPACVCSIPPSAIRKIFYFCLNSFGICSAVSWTAALTIFHVVAAFSVNVEWQMLTVVGSLNVSDHNNYMSTFHFPTAAHQYVRLTVLPCFLSLVIKGLVFDYLPVCPAPLGLFACLQCQAVRLLTLYVFFRVWFTRVLSKAAQVFEIYPLRLVRLASGFTGSSKTNLIDNCVLIKKECVFICFSTASSVSVWSSKLTSIPTTSGILVCKHERSMT